MRIAYVCADPGVPVFGCKGCSVHVQEMLRALQSAGAVIDLFAARTGGEAPLDLRGLHVHQLHRPRGSDLGARERELLGANAALRAALEGAGPFDAVYERQSLWSYAAMEYARDSGVAGLLEVNAPLIDEQAQHRGLVDRDGAVAAAARAYAAARALLAVSTGVASYLARAAAAPGRIHVVPNGVDTKRFRPNLPPACPAPAGTFTVGFVGTLKPWHGLPDLVDAIAVLHAEGVRLRLLIVGDGPEREALLQRLEEHRIRHLALLPGAVEPAAVPHWLASMDVAVAPYPDSANCYFSPLKVYEYLAAGLPIVASQSGQLAEVLRDGVTGVFYPPGNVAALAATLRRLAADQAGRVRLGRAARQTARDYTWTGVAHRALAFAGLVPAEARSAIGRSA